MTSPHDAYLIPLYKLNTFHGFVKFVKKVKILAYNKDTTLMLLHSPDF